MAIASSIPALQFFFVLFVTTLARSHAQEARYHRLNFTGAVGPESVVFDNAGGGPYTGVSDGRILKWDGSANRWEEFAVLTPNRRREICDNSEDPELEAECGRPLGLQFNRATGDLYIADAYHGLLVVGPKGGVATPEVVNVEGNPLGFVDGIDINQETGMVYFTDASTVFQRKDNSMVVSTGDRTGRLISYNPITKEVKVLLRGLPFPNGVSVSKNNSFLLISQTSTLNIMRYWLEGPQLGSYEFFACVPGYPDNIQKNTAGDFWVAVAKGTMVTPGDGTVVGIKFNEESRPLEVIGDKQAGGIVSVSEVHEINGTMWIGSVDVPFLGSYTV
ncbi:protein STRICTOSIDINE SYNTHASE-LIKE 10-like [Aristolochia californica]|uniref:protein STRICTOSIDINE SYNTHASE-LIKE 10-like n=1 Tax=Aristolochia californica TaxID=171875 RepID=UPI0035D6F054